MFNFQHVAPCFQFNMSHQIRHLSFGKDYPGIINPLDEHSITSTAGEYDCIIAVFSDL